MGSIHKILVGLLLASSLCLCGCSNNSMYEQQVSKVEVYNNAVEETDKLFNDNEEIARKYEKVIVQMVTCNKIDKGVFNLMNIEDKPDRNEGESEEHYIYRCMDKLFDDNMTLVHTFGEYHSYVNGLSDYTDAFGNKTYKYDNTYKIDGGYYASVSSKYMCQFLVIDNISNTLLKTRIYWANGKIQKIVMQ